MLIARAGFMTTKRYYNEHAQLYSMSTQNVDMSLVYKRFTAKLPNDARLLDAGCGSGRDTRAFIGLGFSVDAFDASPEMAAIASDFCGVAVQVMSFLDLDAADVYDGIWACASLLHLHEENQPEALARLVSALKPGGVLYVSYKVGAGQRLDSLGRHFTDATDSRLNLWLDGLPVSKPFEIWETPDQRPDAVQTWLNALIYKLPTP